MALNTGINSLDEPLDAAADTPIKLEGQQQAGGVYNQGSDVKNALAVWNNMGPADRAEFEGFLDFFRSGEWRDQIQGMRLQQRDRRFASHEGNDAFLEQRYEYYLEQGFSPRKAAEQAQHDLESGNFDPGNMAQGGRIGYRGGRRRFLHGALGARATPDVAPGGGGGGGNEGWQVTQGLASPPLPTPTEIAAATEVGIPTTTIDALAKARAANIPDDVLIGDILQGPTLPTGPDYSNVTGIEGSPLIMNPPRLTAEEAAATEAFVPRSTVEEAAATEMLPGSTALGRLDVEGTGYYDTPEGRQELLDTQENITRTIATDTGTGGEGSIVTDTTQTVPVETPEDTGLTSAEAAQAFEASVAEQMAANEAAKADMPFEHYYVGGDPTTEQTAFMRASGAAPSMVGLERYATARGGRVPAAFGGVMGQDGRRAYGLGSMFKKATKALKSIVKSPVGMAALTAVGLPYLSKLGVAKGMISPSGFLGTLGQAGWKKAILGAAGNIGYSQPGQGIFKPAIPSLMKRIKDNPFPWIVGASALPFLAGEEEDEKLEAMYRGEGLDIPGIRRAVGKKGLRREDYPFMPSDYYAAQGGRAGHAHGNLVDDEEETLRASALASLPEYRLFSDRRRSDKGGRIGAQEGGLMDLGGMEKDYRQEGGFVPIGGQEKADDVPARLSKNEFVFTADAVRAAGGGDIDAGAEVMENVMENLEAGGRISDESQGREGAQGMFANAQQLQNRII